MRTRKTKIASLGIAGLIISGFVFISCHKSAASWDAQILAPVVNASLIDKQHHYFQLHKE